VLPNVLGTPLYGSLQGRVNALGSVSFHAGKDVAVKVRYRSDGRTPTFRSLPDQMRPQRDV
jgi:hypothetical protein